MQPLRKGNACVAEVAMLPRLPFYPILRVVRVLKPRSGCRTSSEFRGDWPASRVGAGGSLTPIGFAAVRTKRDPILNVKDIVLRVAHLKGAQEGSTAFDTSF